MVNGWILKIGRDEMDPQDVAETWIKENQETVNGWISEASSDDMDPEAVKAWVMENKDTVMEWLK